MLSNVMLFPLSRSAGIVRRFAEAQAVHDANEDINRAWQTAARELAEELIGTVPNRVLDAELYRLMDVSTFAADRKRAARLRATAKRQERARPRLVTPAQGDLFTWAAKPVVAARIEGDADASAT